MSERFKAIRILFKSVVGTANVIVILLFIASAFSDRISPDRSVFFSYLGLGFPVFCVFEPLFCCLLAVSLGMAVCVDRTMFVPDLPGGCNPLFPFP